MIYLVFQTLVNYSDCDSENLIPNDRNKKKDRNQVDLFFIFYPHFKNNKMKRYLLFFLDFL